MDRIDTMQALVAVVDGGSLARAARQLGVSAPVVTRALNELEARLGVKLLVRTTRQVRATEAGARYAERCRLLLADLQAAERDAADHAEQPQGLLRVTAPAVFGRLHVAPLVVRFLQQHPLVTADCLFVDRLVNLVEEGVDVALRIGELPDSNLRARRLGQVRRVMVASPGYLAQHGTPQHPDELPAHALIQSSVLQNGEWSFAAGTAPLRVQPRLRTSSNDGALAAAVAGLGIARLMSYQAAAALHSGELACVLADFEAPPLPVHVLHAEGRQASATVRAFVALAVEQLRF